MIQANIKESFLKGGKLAIQRLLDRKVKENTTLFISDRGVPTKVNAKDIEGTKSKAL